MRKRICAQAASCAVCGALAVACLTGCPSAGSDAAAQAAYEAGYHAGQVDGASATTNFSGVVYKIESAYTTTGATPGSKEEDAFVVVNLTAKNVSKDDATAAFTGSQVAVRQGDATLSPVIDLPGLEEALAQRLAPGESCEGWATFRLADTAAPLAIEQDAELFYGLENPQTIDLASLEERELR